ncbi:MAG TPA: hypothetical protein VGO00_15160 [Kofleriaceae bacterium]|jgi:hypothetical protein|nr:hypothetical protein [Kofleriaceae bacterium]
MSARACLGLFVVVATSTARADEPLPNSVPSVMDRPWAFAIGFGCGVMQPQTDDTRLFAYGLIQAALRYRPLDVLEVGVSMTSGGTFDFGQAGLYADLRYRLIAEEAWNPFLLLGIGASLATSSNMSPLNDFRRSLRLGVGIERRFVSWGFAAELHMFAIGGNDDVATMFTLDTPAQHLSDSTVLGGSLSAFAIYYWGRGTRTHRLLPVQ